MHDVIEMDDRVLAVPCEYGPLPAGNSIVSVVDGDSDARSFVGALLRAAGHGVATFRNSGEFFCRLQSGMESCLLVDAGPQGLHGIEVLHQLAASLTRPAVVLMTDHGDDIAMAVRAMKAGAVDVLAKPLVRDDVLEAVDRALAVHRLRRESRDAAAPALQCAASLTPRERQVMALVTAGLKNLQVAQALNLSEISIKIHRGNLMKKMGVRTLPDLVRAADLISRFV